MECLNLKIFKIILTTFVLVSACCNKEDENSGAIISDLIISDLKDYQQIDCYSFLDTLCIRDDSTYEATFTLDPQKAGCNNISRPFVDFSGNSILIYSRFESANLRFNRNVTIDSVKKTVTYTISTDKCFCADKCFTEDFNMVLVPRIGRDYRIIYK
jgi:hypothetical protein